MKTKLGVEKLDAEKGIYFAYPDAGEPEKGIQWNQPFQETIIIPIKAKCRREVLYKALSEGAAS